MESELPKPGDLIGVRYRIESMLGKGGMGAVFAAVNQATGRAVAIKWMLPGAARSQESLARFLAEARATAKIEHPNVIQILDVGQDNHAPFLVMERLRGRSLAERLAHGRLSTHETLSVLIPALRGIAEAHSEGIIHRDLKPDNIFLCEGKDGSPRPPKVLDFGISKLYDQEGGTSLTQTGIAMGTPQYMSPEQLNAPPDADARFDVYAMGVVLYECLTGRPPYNADGLFELVQQIASGNPTPIRMLAPDVPPDLEAVVMRAMHVNRDYRHRTIPELIAALEQVQARIQSGAPAPYAPMPVPQTGGVTPAPAPSTGPMGGGGWTPQGGYASGQQYGYPPTGAVPPPGTAGHPTGVAPAPSRGGSGMLIGLLAGGLVLVGLLVVGVAAVVFFVSRGDDSGGTSTPTIGTAGLGGGEPTPVVGPGTTGTGGSSRTPQIGLTFTGDCQPRFTARVMVTGGADALSVVSSTIGGITGSLTLMLPNQPGTVQISTRQRMDTQTVINVMQGQQIWTNMTIDVTPVLSGRIPDPVRGSVTITEFDAELARADITFHDVTLQNMQNGGLCTVNGRLQTFGTTYGL